MSLLRCLKYVNPNQLLGNKELSSRILSAVQVNHQLLKLDQQQQQNDFDQKRFARFNTVKRRLTHKRLWWMKKTTKRNHNRTLTIENQDFIQKVYKDQYSSPLNNVQIESKVWTPESKRTGLIARKIGKKGGRLNSIVVVLLNFFTTRTHFETI